MSVHSTYFGLMAEFGSGEIRLADCCEKYFGLNEAQAKRKAAAQDLPIPTYRAVSSQKGEILVSLADLAAHLDKQKEEARKLFDAFNQDPHAAGSRSASGRPTTRAM